MRIGPMIMMSDDEYEPRDEPPMSDEMKEARVMDLEMLCAVYSAPCQFTVGDLVTPRSIAPYTRSGEPHIVIEVPQVPVRNFNVTNPNEIRSNCYGQRCDMRILGPDPDCISPYWVESWAFEFYRGPGSH